MNEQQKFEKRKQRTKIILITVSVYYDRHVSLTVIFSLIQIR